MCFNENVMAFSELVKIWRLLRRKLHQKNDKKSLTTTFGTIVLCGSRGELDFTAIVGHIVRFIRYIFPAQELQCAVDKLTGKRYREARSITLKKRKNEAAPYSVQLAALEFLKK